MVNLIKQKELTGAQIFMEALKSEGVKEIWGYPGAILLSIYEELYKSNDIKHYLVRHEQAAVHAAEGYSRVSGKCGVALVTSGPGATNTITGLANAYLDGYPVIVFSGQVPASQLGSDAFQEVDIIDMTRACTKKNYLVKNVNELYGIIKEAFYIAMSGKPGPVLIDIPKNVLETKCEFEPHKTKPIKKTPTDENKKDIIEAVELLKNAKKPIIISGGGVISANASKELTQLAQILNCPVANTLMGLGSYGIQDETNLGMLGVLGNFWANLAVTNCDVLFAVGTRLNDRILGPVQACSKNAKVIHLDIDEVTISRMFKAEIEIVADAKAVLITMLEYLKTHKANEKTEWINQISSWKSQKHMPEVESDKMHSYKVLEKIYACTKKYNPIFTTEVGQHQMWAAQCFKLTQPRKFLTSGGLGTMGFGFPAAMGAQIASPESLVATIAGDGSIQMNIQELATCMEYNLPIKVFIINNGYLGMVRQWQEKLYDKHYCGTEISGPDFVKVAQAYGAKGIRVEKEEDIESAINDAIKHDGPVFVDFITESFDFAYPWVQKG